MNIWKTVRHVKLNCPCKFAKMEWKRGRMGGGELLIPRRVPAEDGGDQCRYAGFRRGMSSKDGRGEGGARIENVAEQGRC